MSKTFTLTEVNKHNTKQDCWMVYKKKVYDVTKFLEQHPGGEEVLLDVAGKDATQDFDDVGHSEEAHNMMKDYLIGELDASDAGTSSSPKSQPKATTPAASNKDTNEGSLFSYLLPIGVVVLSVVAYIFFARKD